ncbi:hypothetical protein PVAND_003141 [Polypedilum vanderplanki]|uniref:SLC26A/SulP transporter domain-containing protein n=1 Tax=Polypedilum vanderplanki TaxID=319348 RepID=A0A9J6BTK5_POLVA|nr:hypothetical protein PVAND_003141 [Polypedilum vanderplanki]
MVRNKDKGRSNNKIDSSQDLYSEKFPNILNILIKSSKDFCTEKSLKRRFPIIQWIPYYNKSKFLFDIVAGLSVALTMIPQGIAYAIIAGLPPQYGLYSSFMGCFMYTIFGSCSDVNIGPTAIMALLTYSPVTNFNANFAFLGTFLVGCIVFMFGILNLGFLIQFISIPTITGFVTAATITIGSSQVKPLLGIKNGASGDFLQSWKNVFIHYNEIRLYDTLFGLISLVLLIAMKKPKGLSKFPIFSKYLSISRNAIVVILGIIIAYIFHINGKQPFRLTGTVAEGLPTFQIPPMKTQLNGREYNFFEMTESLGVWLITLPLVSILETIAIAKAFSKGKIVDCTQEIITLGLCNITSSFFRSIPVSGAFSRTAINHNSGVKTQFGGVIAGCIVLLSLSVLTGIFFYIPKTTLAAVMIAAMISMLEFHEIIEIYKTKRIDFIPFLRTFIISLWLGLDFGILTGVAINVLMSLYSTSRPVIHFKVEKIDNNDVLIITSDRSVNYSSAEYFKSAVMEKTTMEFPDVNCIFMNGTAMNNTIDITAAKNIISLVDDLKVNEKQIYFWNWEKEAFHLIMRLNKDLHDLFRFGNDLNEIMSNLKEKSKSQLTVVTTDELI